jgi:hypothetical protein
MHNEIGIASLVKVTMVAAMKVEPAEITTNRCFYVTYL